MDTITDWQNKEQFLSDDFYQIISEYHPNSKYNKGTIVRLISGVDGKMEPGHHFDPAYKTVCRVEAQTAEFCGIPVAYLRRLSKDEIDTIRAALARAGE